MTLGLLDMPVEIRLDIYARVFGAGKAIFESGTQTEPSTFVPARCSIRSSQPRTGQLLRACKTVFMEAESILYANTEFGAAVEAFAGKLPTRVCDDGSVGPKLKHLKWQLKCDMMKRFYPEDLEIESKDLMRLDTLELRCQSENWRQPLCGEWCDNELFTQGHNELIEYARGLKRQMKQNNRGNVYLKEDLSQLARGKVILFVQRKIPVLADNEILLDD